ncbi:MAG: hypothetical protein HOD60_09810 [Candidatus Nitrosopelagicus sp.]|jgi:hypothetical protein|nr:hypothetical protein [Candidatus Nitrosopelagicus sp.]
MYGANCSKCAVGNPGNFGPNPINNYQHKPGNQKQGSWIRAFGRGVAGIFLFLFGLGMVFATYYYFDNLDNLMRNVMYSTNFMTVMILYLIIFPAILLTMGGISIYYGIRIISKT